MKLLVSVMLMLFFTNGLTADDYQDWKQARLDNLKKPHGWLSLVAMEWLYQGQNSLGSAADNDIQLSDGPDYVGHFSLQPDQSVLFTPAQGVDIKANGQPVTETIRAYADLEEPETTVFRVGSYEFYVIERHKKALRIKDANAETRLNFKGLDYFPEQTSYRVWADFVPYEPAKIIQTVNVLGQLYDEPSPGRLEFTLNGERFSLDAFEGGDSYYLVFGDKTNGRTTYGPGRFLYSEGLVNNRGQVMLDFNKAYNPPCAFTAYSTCTLPPLQNRLQTAIKAGEKKYGDSPY